MMVKWTLEAKFRLKCSQNTKILMQETSPLQNGVHFFLSRPQYVIITADRGDSDSKWNALLK